MDTTEARVVKRWLEEHQSGEEFKPMIGKLAKFLADGFIDQIEFPFAAGELGRQKLTLREIIGMMREPGSRFRRPHREDNARNETVFSEANVERLMSFRGDGQEEDQEYGANSFHACSTPRSRRKGAALADDGSYYTIQKRN